MANEWAYTEVGEPLSSAYTAPPVVPKACEGRSRASEGGRPRAAHGPLRGIAWDGGRGGAWASSWVRVRRGYEVIG